MASTIKLKRGSGVPSGGSLAAGEPALDLTNNKLYSSTDGTDVVEIGTVDNLSIDITASGIGVGTGRISIGNTDVTSSGNGVVAIGDASLGGISTSAAYGCIGVGYGAGESITTGDNNICIGQQAGGVWAGGSGSAPEIGTGYNNILLGWRAAPSSTNANDEITLGNAFHTNLRCNDTSISTLSDARDKTDIVDSTYGVEWLKGVKVRKYKWQSREGNGKDGLTRLGFIAQELQEACGECNAILDIVQENNPDQLEIKMSNLIPILTKAIQELAARVEELEAS